jgi:hypothetical protein
MSLLNLAIAANAEAEAGSSASNQPGWVYGLSTLVILLLLLWLVSRLNADR